MPMTLTRPGASRSISRAALKIHQPSGSRATSHAISNSTPQSISATMILAEFSATSFSLTHSIFGTARTGTKLRQQRKSSALAAQNDGMPENPKTLRNRISAGLLMFRRRNNELEVLLAHPGGPFHVHKDDGAWTIPKGEAAPGEDLLTRAQIEFEEEVGFRPENAQEWIALGWIKQKGGKIVHGWAFEGDLPESFEPKSNLFEMEWPPRSGNRQQFPEIDRAEFFSEAIARQKMKPTQIPFLDRLRTALQRAVAS